MRKSLQFADEIIAAEGEEWENSIRELGVQDDALFFNETDSPLQQVAEQPETFLARLPRSTFASNKR